MFPSRREVNLERVQLRDQLLTHRRVEDPQLSTLEVRGELRQQDHFETFQEPLWPCDWSPPAIVTGMKTTPASWRVSVNAPRQQLAAVNAPRRE